MGRLYWFIIDDEDSYTPEKEIIYIVRRKNIDDEFVFKTKNLAMKCMERLISLYPEECGEIDIHKRTVRTQYR